MNKPRIFLGSSGEQAKLLRAIARGLTEVADVEPWTTTFNPGRSTQVRQRIVRADRVDEVALQALRDQDGCHLSPLACSPGRGDCNPDPGRREAAGVRSAQGAQVLL